MLPSLCVCVILLVVRYSKWADVSVPLCTWVCALVCVSERVSSSKCVFCVCVCLSEWALSGAAPCCASCIWSHLFWCSVGGERMTLMYLNPRQTFPRHSSVWNKDNWAQSSWTDWSGWWAVDRRVGYTVTPVRLTREPLAIRDTQTLESVSMIGESCFGMGGHSNPPLAYRHSSDAHFLQCDPGLLYLINLTFIYFTIQLMCSLFNYNS